jgi:hypothetical protein
MESIDWNITETHTKPEGSGTPGAVDTAGPDVVGRGPRDIYENSTRQNRLEWRC